MTIRAAFAILATAFICTPALACRDMPVATIQNASQNGFTTQTLCLTKTKPIPGMFVALSPSGLGRTPLMTYNWNPATQLARYFSDKAAGTAEIVALGDSTSRGFGSSSDGWTETGFPAELAQAMVEAGSPAQSDSFLGEGLFSYTSADLRVSFIGGAQWGGAVDAGGPAATTAKLGDGFNFALNWPDYYDRVSISYEDIGGGTLSLYLDRVPSKVATLQIGNSGATLTQTFAIAPGLHHVLQARQVGAAGTYVQGVSFWSSTNHAVQVMNAAIGGWTSGGADTSICNGTLVMGSACGVGQTAGVVALHPSLVLLNLGINDILAYPSVPEPTTITNISQIIATLQAAGSDVILMVPTPFADSRYLQQIGQLDTDLRALAVQKGIGLIDLSATYSYNFPALSAAGLMGSDSTHPDATFYADIAAALAGAL